MLEELTQCFVAPPRKNQALRDAKGDDCVGIEASSSGRAPSFGAASLKATPDGMTGNVASKRDAVFRRNELASIDKDMVEADLVQWNAAVLQATVDQNKIADLAGQVNDKEAEVDKYAKELDDKIAQSRKLLDDISGEFDQAKSETASMIDAHIDQAGMDVEKFESDLESAMESKLTEIRKAVADKVAKLTENQKVMQEKLIQPVSTLVKQISQPFQVLSKTHYMDRKQVVYHWNEWSVYNGCCVGWFDNNNPRGFGGKHPSEWGDGNAYAHQMNSQIKYIKRIFSSKGHGDDFGATVCAYTWMMPHSTDDHRCGAVFRIKNTATSSINWNMQWYWTGWGGWGNRASVGRNRQNIWDGDCYGTCHRTENINMPANSAKNRVSTVIFMAGGAYPYGHYNHWRYVYLSFSKLSLPNNLEFADDLETATGNWD